MLKRIHAEHRGCALICSPPAGAKVPITSYTCTQPNYPIQTFSDNHQYNVSSGLWTCETKGGAHPNLLDSDTRGDCELYVWNSTLLWCWNSPRMVCWESEDDVCRCYWYPTSKSFSPQCRTPLQQHWQDNVLNISEEATTPVVMNLTALLCEL